MQHLMEAGLPSSYYIFLVEVRHTACDGIFSRAATTLRQGVLQQHECDAARKLQHLMEAWLPNPNYISLVEVRLTACDGTNKSHQRKPVKS